MTQFEKDRKAIEDAMKSGKRTRLEIELNPEMVEWLLAQRSNRQRNISKARVEELLRSILRYGWYQCDDFKMASHGLVNGQHRLTAIKKYLKYQDPAPCLFTGIVVNVSEMETQLFDTGLSRTRVQRLKMKTGEEPNHNIVSSVVFELSYPQLTQGRKIPDEDVLRAVNSSQWKRFCDVFPPGTTLPNYVTPTPIPTPIYVAIKQLWERCPHNTWDRFQEEFQGPGASKYIQKLRELIAIGYKAFKGKSQDARALQYGMAVDYLNAFANGYTTLSKKHRYEWTGMLADAKRDKARKEPDRW